jgi:very-short-patch-repair endonuclease
MAEIAARQHGVVAREQVVRAGIPPHAIDHRVKQGRLEVLYRGVYRVGPLGGNREREMAAVLASGDGSVVSHRSAAAVWGHIPRAPASATVDTIIPGGRRRPGPGVRAHRVALAGDEVTRRDGLPITTPARTLLDLAACAEPRELERALAWADREQQLRGDDLAVLLARYPRRGGTRALRALVDEEARPSLTRSEAEERFLELIRKAGLRRPKANVVVRGCEADFFWPAERLVVEIDGFAYHASRTAFERDHQRDGILTAAGLRVMRVTWRQLTAKPELLLVQVAQALARTGGH